MSLSGAGKIAGVIGWPVAHSLSPALHGYWLAENSIDGALVPLHVAQEDFAKVVTALRRAGFVGVNVTVPHKQAAFALADACDDAAKAASAVNLLVFGQDGRLQGRNTDAVGLAQSLREALGESLAGQDAVLLGAGGAARGAVVALAGLGIRRIHILARQAARAKALASALAVMVKSELIAGDMAAWPNAAKNAALLVNATSAGMKGHDPLVLDLTPLPKSAAVCDIVYNPLATDLLLRAGARGHVCIDGLGMLMHQAAPSFEVFFGVRPKVTAGLRAMLQQVLGA